MITPDALREALQTTADALENVLSADPDMPTYQADYDEGEAQLERARQILAMTTTPLAGEVLDERGHWQPRIGSEVRVSERYAHYGDWQRDRLWVAGIQKNRTDDGLNITVAHEWPQTMGGTDGFYINRPFKPDDLEPVNGFALVPTPSNIGDAEAREAIAQRMAESVDLDWSTLPDEPDAACGYGMPEGCKSYWRRLANLSGAGRARPSHPITPDAVSHEHAAAARALKRELVGLRINPLTIERDGKYLSGNDAEAIVVLALRRLIKGERS